MTIEDAIQKLKECQVDSDDEQAHMDADDVLCELLSEIGYSDVVAEYKKVRKLYT
jgi:hypothetical protein